MVHRWIAYPSLLLLVAAGLIGCRRGVATTVSREPVDVAALAAKSPHPADLSATFNIVAWTQAGSSHAPLSVAAQLAASAGGDWLAVMPKRRDDLKWQPSFQTRYPGMVIARNDAANGDQDQKVSSCLAAIRKAGASLSWENRNGRMLLYFGSDEELGHARAHPPTEVAGLCARAHNASGLLACVADFWKVRIEADPSLLDRRDRVMSAHQASDKAEEARGMMGVISRMYRGGIMPGGKATRAAGDALVLLVEERTSLEGIMQQVARLLGGRCIRSGTGWKLFSLTEQREVQAELTRLKQVITEKSGTEYLNTTANPMTGEQVVVIGTPEEAVQQAIDSLAALGPSSLPTLRELLSADKASIARAVLQDLAALNTTESRRAVTDFGDRLLTMTVKPGKQRSAVTLLLDETVRALAARPSDEAGLWLAKAARDPRISGVRRLQARTALVESGRLALLEARNSDATRGYQLASFTLTAKPDGKPFDTRGIPAITPLATSKARDGSTWAVFLSGRCGDPYDFWLAHGTGDRWSEFLFTGKTFKRDNIQYMPWVMKMPGPGSLSLKVLDNAVELGPPAGQAADSEMLRLRQQLQHGKLSASKRQRVAQQLAMRQQMQWQRRMTQLQETIRIDLTEIRKDADKDGLTDLVEQRLGTDPARADTDGDGVPDGEDRNPLVPRVRSLTDRQRLIQAVFASLYAGDPNPDPIVVVLDSRDWMEFPGVNAPVYCLTKEQYGRRIGTLSYFRVLQFGGPGPSGTTILNVDGPVAYNESRTRAEVHFWQWQGKSVPANPWMAIYAAQFTTSSTPIDYVAIFRRKGAAWTIESLRPWQPDSADAAMGDMMEKQIESGSMQ